MNYIAGVFAGAVGLVLGTCCLLAGIAPVLGWIGIVLSCALLMVVGKAAEEGKNGNA